MRKNTPREAPKSSERTNQQLLYTGPPFFRKLARGIYLERINLAPATLEELYELLEV